MKVTSAGVGIFRFGPFQADARTGELRKGGHKVRLQEQPFQILVMLLERHEDVVTREELHRKLWPADTFVDFEHGLNNAVNRLREALGDSADTPRYVETLPRRGYRFIARVETDRPSPEPEAPAGTGPVVIPGAEANAQPPPKGAGFAWRILLGAAAAVALVMLLLVSRYGAKRSWLFNASSHRIQSIAVLPLENLSGDPSQEYFAEGMTDALITNLARISSLRVISRTSSIQYKQTHKLLPQIAQELSVDAVVEGTVVRSGDHVRINAQLVRADTDQHLWADSYEGSLDQVLVLQGAVAEAIAKQVRVKLTPDDRARLEKQHAVSPEAYELYLRGCFYLETRTEDGIKKALQYFLEATEKDPSSALAFAGLADAYSLMGSFGFLPEKETEPKAKAAAEKAVSLDSSSAEALTSLAVMTEDPVESQKLFLRAIQSNPGYALAHHWYARFLSESKRYDEALAEIRLARSLDPLSVRIVVNEGEILFLAARFDKALEQFQLALSMNPNFPVTHWVLGRSYFYARRYDDSLSELRKATELNPAAPNFHVWLAIVEEFLGKYLDAIGEFEKTDVLSGVNRAEASARAAALRKALASSGEKGYWQEWIVLRMKDREKSPHRFGFKLAYDYAQLGDKAKAVAWLETCFQERTCDPALVSADPGLDGLRSDPDFQSLLSRVGLSH